AKRKSEGDWGVEIGVEGVDEKVHADVRQCVEHYSGLHHDVVAGEDRVHDEPSQAGPGEDRLDDHVAAKQLTDLQAGDRKGGDQRVAKRVLDDNYAFTQALGPGCGDVLTAEDLDHGGPHNPGQHGGEHHTESQGGQ